MSNSYGKDFTDADIKAFEERYKREEREKCPKGFVPLAGFGNQAICKTCRRPLADHMVIEQ